MAKSIEKYKGTTYTVIKKCLDKGAVSKTDHGFICHAVITKDEAREAETKELINKLYGGSSDMLIASLLGKKNLTEPEIEKLLRIVDEMR